jgi:hypothetical protein
MPADRGMSTSKAHRPSAQSGDWRPVVITGTLAVMVAGVLITVILVTRRADSIPDVIRALIALVVALAAAGGITRRRR